MRKYSMYAIELCESKCSKELDDKGPKSIEARFWAQLATRRYSNNGPYTLDWMKRYQVLGGVKK